MAARGRGRVLEQRRRIGAYGLCRDGQRVLLTRSSPLADYPGVWQVPGGGLEHGEHPARTVVREFADGAGLAVEISGIRGVVADVLRLPDLGVALHTDRVIYDVTVTDRAPRDQAQGTTDRVAWLEPEELFGLPLMPFTAELLDLPVTPLPEDAVPARPRQPYERPPVARGQRFAAYGLVTDPIGRVLLTMIADGYPGAGRWHLPGGGTDHGEQPVAALLRELVEESGQLGRVTHLLDVTHRRNPAALGPEGYPIDWHAVRAIFRVVVDAPTAPRVTEAAGGSTARAAWFEPAEAGGLPTTDVAAEALARLGP